MDNSRRKFIIITASIILHAITLFVILVLYQEPHNDLFASIDPSKAIDITETIFYDPTDTDSPQASAPSSSVFDDWAQLNPRASTLGSSMEMPNGPIGVEMPGNLNGSDDGAAQETESSENSESNTDQNSLEFTPQIKFEDTEFVATSIGKEPDIRKNSDISDKPRSKKSQARKALAGITRGYLQQLKDEGENLIKTLGGDPNKKPTAEQLKYERYLAKIQWCLQNAHSINQEKCPLHEQIDTVMRIYFVLDREGKMTGFKIMQSSGKAYVDQYISSLFQFASSSFPPLPAYVKENYLPLTYTVMVNWNTGSHTGFSRY
ncbi:MAG: hypothetical protein AMXMBFR12_10630 [Candidatus Babeliales bacterium]